MNESRTHPSVLLVWALANRDACLVGSQFIEPIHFLQAILEILDDAFRTEAHEMGFPPEAIQEIGETAVEARVFIGLPDDDLTRIRRNLRSALRRETAPILSPQMLHRSDASRALFQHAVEEAIQARAEEVTLVHLLKCLMDHLPAEAAPFFEGRAGFRVAPLELPPVGEAGRSRNGGTSTSTRSRTQVLDQLGRDLTALASTGRLAPVVGRHEEMTRIARYLMRTTKRNVILVGDAGVGKTAVVEGLAQHLVQENAPDFLRALRLVQINIADLVAGTRYRGDMEERLQKLLEEASSDPNLVLFLDEFHLVMKAGAGGDSPMDIANILKPALSRESFRCIGATTTDEYERYIKDDPAFLRRFQVVRLEEPSQDEALQICQSWAKRIEEIQQVKFDPEAVQAAVTLSVRFIHGRSLPDKAIDLLENAASYVKVSSLTFHNTTPTKENPHIDRWQIQNVLEEQYGISVNASDLIDARQVAADLNAELVGQKEAIAAVAETLAALQVRSSSEARPFAVFLLTGPTGVGKTRLAELLAQSVFGGPGSLLRLNMNEFKERHELSRLAGAPPGFIGHDRPGVLFRFVEGNPQGIILLDEIEKAHPEIQDFFLQIFDKAESIDSRGRKASFRQYIFILTCNLVAPSPAHHAPLGFLPVEEPPSAADDEAHAALAHYFRPEFLGRIDRVVSFRALAKEDYQILFERQLAVLAERLSKDHAVQFEIAAEAQAALLEAYSAQTEGARGFLRLFQQQFATPVVQHAGELAPGATLKVTWQEGKPAFN